MLPVIIAPLTEQEISQTSTQLLIANQYQEFIDYAKSINRLPKESLKLAQIEASRRQLITETFLNQKGLISQMNNHDTLDGQITLLKAEIDSLTEYQDETEVTGFLTANILDDKRKMLANLIKAQSDLQKEMKYSPDKASIQIQNTIVNNTTKLDDMDLFRLHRKQRPSVGSEGLEVEVVG